MSTVDLKVREAQRALQGKIDAAVREAWLAGKDFVHGPLTIEGPDPFAPFDITRPVKMSAEVKGGAVEPGQDWPTDWTVYRCPEMDEDERRRFEAGRTDWQADKWQDHCGNPACVTCPPPNGHAGDQL